VIPALRWSGFSLLATAAWMLFGSLVLKLRARDRLLDRLALRGGERVLDVGCGRGLLVIGAAKRLPRGHAVGLDMWRAADQAGNDPAVTRANAVAEGVAERVTLETGDMCRMPFVEGEFDAVVSSYAIHNVPSAAARAQAVREIARVLKPDGRVELLDIAHAKDYARVLGEAGFRVEVALDGLTFFIPTFRVSARRS
jgi:ubiquinone/menaquinone biosynthesis C-methylase UbiE